MTEAGRWDTLVVGAGSAGCVLAARLSEDPHRRVLLLEAGPDHRAAELPDALRWLSRPIAWPYEWGDRARVPGERDVPYLRGRGIGGSSSTNGSVALRPGPDDFEAWPEGWGWDELLPCFRRLEHDVDFPDAPWHGDAGPIPVRRLPRERWAPIQNAFHEGALSLGIPECDDQNAPDTTGVGPIPMNRDGNARISCAIAFLEPARGRPNLAVRGDAHVRRVLFARNGTPRACGVELASGERIEAGCVLLAGGVIQSPLLLWRSGVGPAVALRELGIEPVVDLVGVGRGLTDHTVMSFATRIRPELFPRGVLRGAPALQTILRTTAEGSARTNDLQLTPWVRRDADGHLELVVSVSLQQPDGAGAVSAASVDPAAHPHIDWPFGGLRSNVERLRAGWRLAARIVEASKAASDPDALARARDESDADLDRRIDAEHAAFYHGVGTCRMGDADDAARVVGCDTSVLGTEGLRVVDASIAPTVPRTNTNLLVAAMAEHAVERMR